MSIAQLVALAMTNQIDIAFTHAANREPVKASYPYILSKGGKKWFCKTFEHCVETINMIVRENQKTRIFG